MFVTHIPGPCRRNHEAVSNKRWGLEGCLKHCLSYSIYSLGLSSHGFSRTRALTPCARGRFLENPDSLGNAFPLDSFQSFSPTGL